MPEATSKSASPMSILILLALTTGLRFTLVSNHDTTKFFPRTMDRIHLFLKNKMSVKQSWQLPFAPGLRKAKHEDTANRKEKQPAMS